MVQAHVTKKAIWLWTLLCDLQKVNSKNTVLIIIHCDNQGAMKLAKNSQYHVKIKHIDIQFHFICQKIEKEAIELCYTHTDEMIADDLIKDLVRVKFMKFCD